MSQKSSANFYFKESDVFSHRVRIVLEEKCIAHNAYMVNPDDLPEELDGIDSSDDLPVLIDENLVLTDHQLIMEYLEERYPHPIMMPSDPISKANLRTLMLRIRKDWDPLMICLENDNSEEAIVSRDKLICGITEIAPIFEYKPYFMSSQFTLVDCMFISILHRLEELGIELPGEAIAITQYAKHIYKRESFELSLNDLEMLGSVFRKDPVDENELAQAS